MRIGLSRFTRASAKASGAKAAEVAAALFGGGGGFDEAELRAWEAAEADAEIDAFVSRLADHLGALEGHGGRAAIEAVARRVPQVLVGRRRRVAATLRLAGLDAGFRAAVRDGDAARDRRDWGAGEHAFWRALQIFPFHPGYRVQYAHCLKEQDKWVDAELEYRSALALGNRDADLAVHIDFVSRRRGAPADPAVLARVAGWWSVPDPRPLAVPPLRADVEALVALLLGRGPAHLAEIADLLAANASLAEIVDRLIGHPAFVTANRDLLTLLVESGWRR
ncbi:hypothetical protein EYW49_06645 [Siculibacillus lacustris]|uniref:Tetratricopeptide repeat protein n=1 Tax=Siculibacillus lacustris TaxID=1549641 RepID=A0A4Q9VTW7_9HYPH|nr:hypothetical protein [Siculibacillus lacustris]TBW39541.1 hypothetical protein EYW49_06645 [Siculibacillus lacustris]